MDFIRPERCRWQRTGRENRRSNFYEVPDNLPHRVAWEAASVLSDGEEITGEGLRFSGPRNRVALIWYPYRGPTRSAPSTASAGNQATINVAMEERG